MTDAEWSRLTQLQGEYVAARSAYDAALVRLTAIKRAMAPLLAQKERERQARQHALEVQALRALLAGVKHKDINAMLGRKGSSKDPIDTLADRFFRRFIPRERWRDEPFDWGLSEGRRSYADAQLNRIRAALAAYEAQL